MFCEQCGKEIADGVKYCRYCGASIKSGTSNGVQNDIPINEVRNDTHSEKVKASKKSGLIYGLLGFAGLILIVIGIIYFATVNTSGAGDLAAEWVLMSGNEEDSYDEDRSGFPSYMAIHKDKTIAYGDTTGEYKLSYTDRSLSINDGEFLYEYKLSDDGNLLYFMEYGSDSGNGDAGIYINRDKATNEELSAYEYATTAYDDMDIEEYLTGYWYDTDDVMIAADDEFSQSMASDFSISVDDDGGKHLSYNLPIPEVEEDATFSVDGNLITVGGLNVYRVIPIGEKKAYFFCYADSSLRNMGKY